MKNVVLPRLSDNIIFAEDRADGMQAHEQADALLAYIHTGISAIASDEIVRRLFPDLDREQQKAVRLRLSNIAILAAERYGIKHNTA